MSRLSPIKSFALLVAKKKKKKKKKKKNREKQCLRCGNVKMCIAIGKWWLQFWAPFHDLTKGLLVEAIQVLIVGRWNGYLVHSCIFDVMS